ncbi:MAG: HAMP domain-containing sensor histidine kinase [Microbacteriaceae bacterium]|nr:HAMP domain-containing sensor histidine kinase [Microbacteriaceae bacterium]
MPDRTKTRHQRHLRRRRRLIRWLRFTDPVLGPLRRRWQRYLSLRLLTMTALITTGMILIAGTYILTSVRDDLTRSRVETALADSARATISAQHLIDTSEASDRAALATLMTKLRGAIRDTSSSQLIYVRRAPGQKYTHDAPLDFRTGPGIVAAITPEIEQKIAKQSNQAWQYVEFTENSVAAKKFPGIVVATHLHFPDSIGQYNLFIGYSFADIDNSLWFLLRTLIFTALILMVLIAGLVWVISTTVFKPVRAAAEASEKLAQGDKKARLAKQNDVNFDVLSRNFNNMADTLQARIAELDTLSTMQQRFVSDVSHELRTPLTTIRLATEVLSSTIASEQASGGGADGAGAEAGTGTATGAETGAKPGENTSETAAAADAKPAPETPQSRAIQVLNDQVDRFEELLTDLLEISRYDAGRVQIDTEPTSIVELCQEVVRRLQPLSDSIIEVRPLGGYKQLDVDPRRIRRIISNLVGNAIEHGEGRAIIVTIDSNTTALAVTVRDHGIGMTETQAQLAFDRFWRADPARKRTLGGTGLGLAIAKEDASVHGGVLEVWSAPGVGSNFRLTLPRHDSNVEFLSPLPLVPEDVATETGWVSRPRRWLAKGGR